MTLHLTRISKNYALHVSDRLVSGGMQDPLANKCIIYWARGAFVSIGYTGLAYGLSKSKPNMPTDEWIAEKLWGRSIPIGRDGLRPVTFGKDKISKWLDIGQSIELLRSELQRAINMLHPTIKQLAFEVVIVGYQETTRRGIEPVVAKIIKTEGDSPFSIERPERDWLMGGKFGFSATPNGYISQNKLSELVNKLEPVSISDSENHLVAAIRDVASKYPTMVGAHCMSVLIPSNNSEPIRIRFIPNAVHIAVFSIQKTKRSLPVSYSPWIIGPKCFIAPSVMIGESLLEMGQNKIILEAPKPEDGIVGYMGAQQRPPSP